MPKYPLRAFTGPKTTLPATPRVDVTGLTIQGQPVGSSLEWTIAMALDKLKTGYKYQVPVLGGRDVRGGTVVDFVVYTVPLPTPVYAQGGYWHGDAHKREKDQWMMRRIRAALNYEVAEPVEIWEGEALDIPSAMQALRSKLGL